MVNLDDSSSYLTALTLVLNFTLLKKLGLFLVHLVESNLEQVHDVETWGESAQSDHGTCGQRTPFYEIRGHMGQRGACGEPGEETDEMKSLIQTKTKDNLLFLRGICPEGLLHVG